MSDILTFYFIIRQRQQAGDVWRGCEQILRICWKFYVPDPSLVFHMQFLNGRKNILNIIWAINLFVYEHWSIQSWKSKLGIMLPSLKLGFWAGATRLKVGPLVAGRGQGGSRPDATEALIVDFSWGRSRRRARRQNYWRSRSGQSFHWS